MTEKPKGPPNETFTSGFKPPSLALVAFVISLVSFGISLYTLVP